MQRWKTSSEGAPLPPKPVVGDQMAADAGAAESATQFQYLGGLERFQEGRRRGTNMAAPV